MNINFISREDININRKSTSKYRELIEAVKKLKPGGKALEVRFKNKRELKSMRNVIYKYNKQEDENIKSNTHPEKKLVYFYQEK